MILRALRLALAVVAMSLSLGACAPRVFSDGTSLTIAATPVEAPVRAAVPARIELREKVQFARDSDRILEVSHGVLDEAVAEILAEPRIVKIRVEGHASADGNDAHNLDLSTRRAQAVSASTSSTPSSFLRSAASASTAAAVSFGGAGRTLASHGSGFSGRACSASPMPERFRNSASPSSGLTRTASSTSFRAAIAVATFFAAGPVVDILK